MEKKQTAVEWLANEITNQLGTNHLLEELFQQAKEMEKYQILDAYVQGNRFKVDTAQSTPDGIEPEVMGAVDYYDNVCDHKDTYIISGVFGGKWCEKCKEMVDKQTNN